MRGILFGLAALLFCTPMAAADEDDSADVAELEKRVAEHREAKDDDALAASLDQIAKVHARATDPKHKERLNVLIGSILKGTRSEKVEKAALKTIGALGDARNWRLVRPYVAQPDAKVTPRLIHEALEATGALKVDEAVPLLLNLVEDSKVYPVAASAIKALGSYGANKRVRAKILGALVNSLRRSVPGGGSKTKTDPDSGATAPGKAGDDGSRWAVLGPPFVEAANRMTGLTMATPEDWFDRYEQYKGKVDKLFEN